jgi:hypothetical protein
MNATTQFAIKEADQNIDDRIDRLAEWLAANAPECIEQAHLDDGTRERAYWHYGYLTALRDMRELLRGNRNFPN